jgi:hypothetical protein
MKKIKQILRESKYTKKQLMVWRIINKKRNEYGICESCFRKTIEMLEEKGAGEKLI